MSRGQGHEVLNKLEAAGLNSHLCQKVIDSKNNELAMKVVRLIENGGFEPSTNQKLARGIMKQNMFGIEEAIKFFGVNPSRQQLACLAEIPFSEEVLKSVKDTHILVAVFPMSILDIRGRVERKLFQKREDVWYNHNNYKFSKDKGEIGWGLVCKTPVANSYGKNWDEQQALLSKEEETPSALIVVYTTVGHLLATGEFLFENLFVRTSSLATEDGHVDVGLSATRGLYVNGDLDSLRYHLLGLASARK